MIPENVRNVLHDDPWMGRCIHSRYRAVVGTGKIQWEHAWTYAGRQINEAWAIVPVREDFNMLYRGNLHKKEKRFNQYIALLRAINVFECWDDILQTYTKIDWEHELWCRIEEFGKIKL